MKKRKSCKTEKNVIDENTVFNKSVIVYGERIKNEGEDCYVLSENDNYGIIGVFDGCGGSGARRYAEYNNKTGAYISSRAAASAIIRWFNEFCNSNVLLSKNTLGDICIDIENNIFSALKQIQTKTDRGTLKGSIQKDFPTTASIILYTNTNRRLYSAFIWCGDSRGYVLQKNGLIQITKDDIDEHSDAFSNLRNDGKLTNVISAEGNFILHGTIVECTEPAIFISATDGSFAYFQSPMAFEYMLLDTLICAASLADWKNQVDAELKSLSGDDYTIGIYIYGTGDFGVIRNYFFDRRQLLYHHFLSKWDDADENEKAALWNEYKLTYYNEVE